MQAAQHLDYPPMSNTERRDRIRVFVTDDHPAIREALSSVISGKLDMEFCGEAASAKETMDLIGSSRPHVAVVDISLEDIHGLELVQEIRSAYPEIQVVVFSMYDEQVYAERAIRAGASGYLMKSEPFPNLIEAIRKAALGDVYLSRTMASSILGKRFLSRGSGPGFAIDELTDRERAVFTLLGEGFSLDEIAEKLGIEAKTVETYRRRAKEKLGLDTVTELLQYALRWSQG